MKDITHIQEITPSNGIYKNKSISRHTTVKLQNPKDNEEILKVARGKRSLTKDQHLNSRLSSATKEVN